MKSGPPARIAATLLAATALGACGTVPVHPPGEDAPLFRSIDARVGTSYAAAARLAFVTSAVMRFEVGRDSVARFEKAFGAMFTDTTILRDWPPWRQEAPAVDAVIELERVEARLELGDGNRKADAFNVAYRVCLYEPDAELIKCWTPASGNSHLRGFGECMDLRPCILTQVEMAMREAIARFLVEAENDPTLLDWAARLHGREARP